MTETPETERTSRPRRRRRWWLWSVGLLAVLVAALLILAPYAIAYRIEHWLTEHGADEVHIGNVDFNPFTGTLVIEGLGVRADGDTVLSVPHFDAKFSVLGLLRSELSVESVRMEDAEIVAERSADGQWRTAGIIPKAGAARTGGGDPWAVFVGEGSISDTRVHLRTPSMATTLSIAAANITGLDNGLHAQPAQLRLQGSLDDSPFTLTARADPFSDTRSLDGELQMERLPLALFETFSQGLRPAGRVNVNVRISLEQDSNGALTVTGNGTADARELALQAKGVQVTSPTLQWRGTAQLKRESGDTELELRGSVQADTARLRGGRRTAEVAGLEWQGNAGVSLGDNEGLRLHSEGKLSTELLRVEDQGRLGAGYTRLHWKGTVGYGTEDVPTDVSAVGTLEIDNLWVAAGEKPRRRLDIDRSVGEQVAVHGTHAIRIPTLSLHGARVTEVAKDGDKEANPVVQLESAKLTQARVTALRDLVIGKISLNKPEVRVVRSETGQWRPGRPAPTPPEEIAPKPGKTPRYRIDAIQIAQGKIQFTDHALAPAVHQTITIEKGQIADIDSAQPEQESHLKLNGQVGKYGAFQVAGTLQPFTDQPRLNLSGDIASLELPVLSPYTARELGYHLKSGQLDAEFHIRVSEGELDTTTKVRLVKLELEAADAAKMEELRAELNMPLESALSLLRDKDGVIELEIPVRGNLNQPQFDFGNAINKAIGNAMKFASMSYLKHTLHPYSTVIILAQAAGKAAQRVRLEPIVFEPTRASLTEEARAYLRRVADLLNERPALQVRICGKAVLEDQPKPPPAPPTANGAPVPSPHATLPELARQRGEAVKDHLISAHGIPAARLFLCRPELDESQGATPRADLGL